jgi:hypothetical protein
MPMDLPWKMVPSDRSSIAGCFVVYFMCVVSCCFLVQGSGYRRTGSPSHLAPVTLYPYCKSNGNVMMPQNHAIVFYERL